MNRRVKARGIPLDSGLAVLFVADLSHSRHIRVLTISPAEALICYIQGRARQFKNEAPGL